MPSSGTELYALEDSMASSTSSTDVPSSFAISSTDGERCSSFVSSSVTWFTLEDSSCRRRGTRTDQPLSRKWRLISPMMVGVANVVNSSPRDRSKRSMALMRPIVPTCTRSSRGSPLFLNLEARKRTRLRWLMMSCSRASSSPSSL